MKSIFRVLTIGIIFFLTFSVKSQKSEFNPNTLKAEYFQSKKIINNAEFQDKKGNSFKICKKSTIQGLYIKKKKEWKKHGVFYKISKGIIKSKTIYSFDIKHGEYESYHSNGEIKKQYTYVNGSEEGKYFEFSEDKSLTKEGIFKNGKKNGTETRYHPNGQIKYICNYVKGLKQGKSYNYNDKGKLTGTSNWIDDNKVK